MHKKLFWTASYIALLVLFGSVAHAAQTAVQIGNGGTGTSTAPAWGDILIGGQHGEYEFVASSTLTSFSPVQSVFGRTGAITAQIGDYTTDQITEGSNLYFTSARAVSALTGQNISLFNNDVGYLNSLAGAASSTLLSDNNTFSGSNTFTQTLNLLPSIGVAIFSQDPSLSTTTVASTTGIFLQNPTAAVSNFQQNSPSLTLEGQGWGTTAPGSVPVDYSEYLMPTQSTVPTDALTWASSISGAPFVSKMTLTSGGVLTPVTMEVNAGSLGSSNVTAGNFWVPSAAAITNETVPQYLFATSSSNGVGIRTGFYGVTATALTIGSNYASVVMGDTPFATAASGVQNWVTTLALKPPFKTSGAAAIGNAATLYIDSAPTSTVNGADYDIYASSTGPDYFGGNVGIATTTPSENLDVNGKIYVEGAANGIILHDTVTSSCYIIQVVSGVITATSHACS